MNEVVSQKSRYPNRWKKGQSGNPSGRPVDAPMFALNQAIRIYRKRHKKDLMMHLVQQAFHDNTVLVALMKKIIPDKERAQAVINNLINIENNVGLNDSDRARQTSNRDFLRRKLQSKSA